MREDLPDSLVEAMDIALKCEATSWVELKKLLLLCMPPEDRKSFSTRDPATKKQEVNDFEREVIDIYYKRTGIMVRLPNDE